LQILIHMATVLITGGTGMIGKALTKALLEKGYEVIILTRNSKQFRITNSELRISYAEWNVDERMIDEYAITKTDFIIHLAGANVGEKRWTKKRKREIVSSRVDSGKLIVESLKKNPNKVKAVVSASAMGWYGPDTFPGGKAFKETDSPFNDFLGQTCKIWEESIEPVAQLGKRLVKLRTGIVLSKEGGAMKEFLRPLKFGLATILGSGKQVISWIYIDDLVNLYIYACENEKLHGVYNAVAPNPISNKKFVLTLAKERNKFFIPIRVPSFALKLLLGEMSIEVLKSATVSCEKIQQAGFEFLYPSIDLAFQKIISS
jgi:uncharacterized protein (TIGR01777 family)